MIEEAFVSFEVAELLKEKGFDEVCWRIYHIQDKEMYGTDGIKFVNHLSDEDTITAPTHQMAMAWLRDEKNIRIFIIPAHDEDDKFVYLADVWIWNEDEGLYESTWCTADYVYEKTVEAALKYCLENLL